jgi:U3 small nucleolar ribonucleoprotein protein LCP5
MAGPSSTNESQVTETETNNVLVQGLQETSQKVEASLLEAIEEHMNSTDFAPSDGLDFLDTKNSLLLSYLIDLTLYLRDRLSNKSASSDDASKNRHRLTEMKTALDKLRGLDKKLRYQIDKLIAAGTTATAFVTGGEDPLQFRPNAAALEAKGNNSSSDDGGEDSEGDDADSGQDDEEDIDADLAAARMTMTMAKDKSKNEESEEDTGVYRAPRISAVPYTHDQVDKQAEKDKRERRRLRASELAQTLRSQYGEAPETEDMHGGSNVGKQREAARRMADKEAEKTRFEEETMVRMTVLRKDKKEQKRLLREENSNLSAIADLGNLVRESEFGDTERRKSRQSRDAKPESSNRYANGKRVREQFDREGRPMQQGAGKDVSANNSFQAALYGTSEGKSKKKKGKR